MGSIDEASPPLTPADVDRFHERGVVRVSEAFPREVALQIQDTLWRDLERRLGIRRFDPDSWYAAKQWGFQGGVRSSAGQVQTARLSAALDQLLGAGQWAYPKQWGGLLVGPPSPTGTPWTLTDRAWHWDDISLEGAAMFCLYSDLESRSGGTLLVEGSGRLLQDWYQQLPPGASRKTRNLRGRFLASHPFLRRLSGRDPVDAADELLSPYVDDDGNRLRVTEVTGRAGDVYVIHSNLLHAKPVHTGTQPRFLAVRGIEAASHASLPSTCH